MSDAAPANVVQFPRKPTQGQPLGSLGDTTANLQTAKPGDSGPNVSALQAALASWGFNPGAVDGAYGPNTSAAVKQLQTALHVTADGIFGPNTLQMVQADLAMPHGILPRKANPELPATPAAPAGGASHQIINPLGAFARMSTPVKVGLGVAALGGIFLIFKAFTSGPSAPAPAPSAPPLPNTGVAGSEFFDGDDEDELEVQGEVVERKSKKRKAKAKAKRKAAPKRKALPADTEEDAQLVEEDEDEDPGFAQDLPDDYDFEGDDLIHEHFEEDPEA